MIPFQLDLPLPPGTTLVEASAGTGKTWSISRLVTRLLAEDGPGGEAAPTVDQLLVVTFTRAAAAELRERVRAAIVEGAARLEEAGTSPVTERPRDPLAVALLAATPGDAAGWRCAAPAVLAVRAARLRRAARDFDTAAISTIHGFCQAVLRRYAVEAGAPLDATLLEDVDGLVDELVGDAWSTTVGTLPVDAYQWLIAPAGAGLSVRRLTEVAHAVVGDRSVQLAPFGVVDWRRALDARRAAAAVLADRWAGAEGRAAVAEAERQRSALKAQSYKEGTLAAADRAVTAWLAAGGLTAPDANPLFPSKLRGAVKNNHAFSADADPLLIALEAHAAAGRGVADATLGSFAAELRAAFDARLARERWLTHDQVLQRVCDGLARPALVDALRKAYRVALIDEFQDTDAVQWAIFGGLFGDTPAHRLLLIGDPKQAIYGFRGADVAVYARAAAQVAPDRRFTLDTNRRSDAPLVASLNQLLGQAPDVLEHPEIRVEPVRASHPARIHGPAGEAVAPVTLRWVAGEDPGTALGGRAAEAQLVAAIAWDVAADLERGWSLTVPPPPGGGAATTRPVTAGDLAVLVTTNRSAAAMRDALAEAGVPAVVDGGDSVFASEEAAWLCLWLDALAAEGRDAPARRAAVCPLYGFSAAELLAVREGASPDAQRAWSALLDGFAAQRRRWHERGVYRILSDLLQEDGPRGTALLRIAARPLGERHLTNLRHLAELADVAVQRDRLSPGGLLRWLEDRRDREDGDRDAAELRLASDGDAVRVVTLHKSKGLEYPIVYLPHLADGRVFRGGTRAQLAPLPWHDADGIARIDLRGRSGADRAALEAARRDLLLERQRLLYVALTRGRHRVQLYGCPWANDRQHGFVANAAESALAWWVHGAGAAPGGRSAQAAARLLDAKQQLRVDAMEDGLRAWAAEAGIPVIDEAPSVPRRFAAHAQGTLPETASFSRTGLDTVWRRESYSGLVGGRTGLVQLLEPDDPRDHDAEITDAPGEEGNVDGADQASVFVPVAEPPDVVPPGASLHALHPFPGGAEAGSWVHGVLEHLSFPTGAPKDPHETLAACVRAHGRRNGFVADTADAVLCAALPAILHTPLGPAFGDRALADIPDADRLDELAFDLPIGPGDGWSDHRWVSGSEVAALVGQARPDAALPAGYLDHVRQLGLRPLAGYFTGAIDLVARVPVDGRWRYFVVDYKSNRLGPRVGGRVVRSCAGHYATPWMAAEIAKKHYYLQYVFYLVALHRYLTVRLPDYDYDRDVGGAAYLFLRGMQGRAGDRNPDGTPWGVFVDKPPADVVVGLSERWKRVERR
jgi:exodeoxyribonuclease V beta subunit